MQQRTIALLLVLLMAAGCGKRNMTGGDKPKETQGNPITDAQGPIGQGGDPAAMAVRRAAQQTKVVGDFGQLKLAFQQYRIDAMPPTSEGFIKYIEQNYAREAPALVKKLKDGEYVVRVSRDSILAYEKEKDYQNTRVVLINEAVTKTMPEEELQAALKKGQ